MKTLEISKRNEKIVLVLSLMSVIAIIVGIVSGILYLMYKKEYLDTVAVYGLTAFMIPFVLLQVAMPANYHNFGINSLRWFSLVFFLILFPFCDMWFFAGINALYHIVPDYHFVKDAILQETLRYESARQSFTYIGIIYVSLISLGFLIRFSKGMFTKKLILN